jgi:hypothetical protein
MQPLASHASGIPKSVHFSGRTASSSQRNSAPHDVMCIRNLTHLFLSDNDADKLKYVEYLQQAIGHKKNFQICFDRQGNAIIDHRPTRDYREEYQDNFNPVHHLSQSGQVQNLWHQQFFNQATQQETQVQQPAQQNFRTQHRYTNSLAQRAADPDDGIKKLSNDHFSVIHARGTEKRYESPHLLAIPRWKNPKAEEPYENFVDFLNRASDQEKIAFVDTMRNLINQLPLGCSPRKHPHFPQQESLLWMNCGKRREVPYMHMHFKPPKGSNYQHLFS